MSYGNSKRNFITQNFLKRTCIGMEKIVEVIQLELNIFRLLEVELKGFVRNLCFLGAPLKHQSKRVEMIFDH